MVNTVLINYYLKLSYYYNSVCYLKNCSILQYIYYAVLM